MQGINIWSLLIILVIVALIFGTKKLGNAGKDVGRAVKGIKEGLGEDKPEAKKATKKKTTKKKATKKKATKKKASKKKASKKKTGKKK